MVGREVVAVHGDGWRIVDKCLEDDDRTAVGLLRFGGPSGRLQRLADQLVAHTESVSVVGDSGVVVEQLLKEQRRAVIVFQRLGRPRQIRVGAANLKIELAGLQAPLESSAPARLER